MYLFHDWKVNFNFYLARQQGKVIQANLLTCTKPQGLQRAGVLRELQVVQILDSSV